MYLCYSCENEISKCGSADECRYDLPMKVYKCKKYSPSDGMKMSMKEFEAENNVPYDEQLKSMRFEK